MYGLKRPIKRRWRCIAVLQTNINHFIICTLYLLSHQAHSPAPDIFRKRYPSHIGKHSLKMIGRAASNLSERLVVNFLCQMFLDIIYCLIQSFNPFHVLLLLFILSIMLRFIFFLSFRAQKRVLNVYVCLAGLTA